MRFYEVEKDGGLDRGRSIWRGGKRDKERDYKERQKATERSLESNESHCPEPRPSSRTTKNFSSRPCQSGRLTLKRGWCYEHGPTWTYSHVIPHVIKKHTWSKTLPNPSREPRVMAHQPMTSFLIFIIEALCASPHSLSDRPEDHHRTLQGNPRDSPKVMLPKELMTLVLRTKSIAIQWHYTLITGQCDNTTAWCNAQSTRVLPS